MKCGQKLAAGENVIWRELRCWYENRGHKAELRKSRPMIYELDGVSSRKMVLTCVE